MNKIIGIGNSGINFLNHLINKSKDIYDYELICMTNKDRLLDTRIKSIFIKENYLATLDKNLINADKVFLITGMGSTASNYLDRIVDNILEFEYIELHIIFIYPFKYESDEKDTLSKEFIERYNDKCKFSIIYNDEISNDNTDNIKDKFKLIDKKIFNSILRNEDTKIDTNVNSSNMVYEDKEIPVNANVLKVTKIQMNVNEEFKDSANDSFKNEYIKLDIKTTTDKDCDTDDILTDIIQNSKFDKKNGYGLFDLVNIFKISIYGLFGAFLSILFSIGYMLGIVLCFVGYIANFHAIYIHWTMPITLQYLAEFIGIIVFPLGILMGWIHLFL